MDVFTTIPISLLSTFATAAAFLLAIPAVCLLILTVSAGGPQKERSKQSADRRSVKVAILVPAHNESAHVLPTLLCLKKQLSSGDRLIVIADNCQDDTAALALTTGAEVLERTDAKLRGKGYALAFGVDALRASPPDVLVVVDADCTLSDGAIDDLAQRCVQTQCPVQMLDLMIAPPDAGLRTRILEFAWLLKNQVRAQGSAHLGHACHLMGTGMAFPWGLAAQHILATGHIAEDMKLGVDLTIAGYPTQFLSTSQITSEFPLNAAVARAQKSRWEHGHLTTLSQELPKLMTALLRRPSLALMVLTMDLVIPPLALYFVCLAIATPLLLLGNIFSIPLQPALLMVLLAWGALMLAVGLAWLRYATHLLSARELISIPLYAAWKLPIYFAYLIKRKSSWTKTERKV